MCGGALVEVTHLAGPHSATQMAPVFRFQIRFNHNDSANCRRVNAHTRGSLKKVQLEILFQVC